MKELSLNPGQVMLVSAKGVKGDKVSLEFAQNITSSINLVSLLNASDERFSQNGPRRAWLTGTREDIQKQFKIDVSKLELGEVLEIGQLNPTIQGVKLNIEIIETINGTEYDVANFATTAKRAGKDGAFITDKNGNFIYQKLSVVAREPKHVFIEDTMQRAEGVSNTASSAIEDALANA